MIRGHGFQTLKFEYMILIRGFENLWWTPHTDVDMGPHVSAFYIFESPSTPHVRYGIVSNGGCET